MNLSKTLLIITITFAIAECNITAGFTEDQTPLINEVMSSNATIIQDEDGDYSDWIEIYNPGASSVDLTGYGLSDDSADPYKWVFPNYILNSWEYMLVFTSDKNRTIIPNYWETVISLGDEWRYVRGSYNIPENWRSVEFDDSEWQLGPSGIGSRSGYDSTVVQQSASLFIRKTFTVDDIANITYCLLQIDYDDGFVAYINGNEIARANIGVAGIPPPSSSLASDTREMQMYAGGNPEVYKIDTIQSILQQGENVLAIQIHNRLIMYSDISVIPFLTFGMTTPPSDPRGVPDILKFSTSAYSFHTNFKITSGGETIILTDSSGVLCDSLDTGTIAEDISFGRKPDGEPVWVFFPEPTPGESNSTEGITGYADIVMVSLPGGFYNDSISIELSVNSPDAKIRYTLDGSAPSDSSSGYFAPISIDSTTVLRARAFEPGLFPSKINTNTYLINENIALPVISISINPEDLWDDDIGIYVRGNSEARGGYPVNPTGTGNYYEDWEKPIHIEFYEPDGSVGFSIDAGMKMTGKGSRQYPQKALAIFARPEYGYDEMDHKIFPDQPITKFKSIVLRTGGQDQYFDTTTYFRDGLHQTLMQPLDLEVQAYRPAVVFLNGAYWGIHNIREKLNEDYLAAHHGVDPDEVDILDDYHAVFVESGILQEYTDGVNTWTCFVIEGNPDHYHALLRYMIDHDESDSTVYEYLKTQIDIENFIDYMVSRIYISDPDGPGHNTKFWRPQTPNGKWRWLMYDTEWGFGIVKDPFGVPGPAYLSNFLDYYRRPIQQANRFWDVNFMMNSLQENDNFKYDFVNRYADYLNTIYSPEQVIPQIMALKSAIEPEVPRHLARWSKEFNQLQSDAIDSIEDWYNNIDKIIEFAEKRPYYTRLNVVSEFDLSGTADVTLDVSQSAAGKINSPDEVSQSAAGEIKINTLTVGEYPWTGTYFQDIPVKLTAVPNPGYTFTGWTGVEQTDAISITVTLTGETSVTANFEEDTTAINTIVINEINYNSSNTFNPEDWVELYNAYDIPVDISDWVFKDEDDAHIFIIPENTVIAAGDYLVLCRDDTLFHAAFPEVDNYIGNLSFGLGAAGELIRLFNTQGDIVDSLTYDDEAPWPVEPDGNGPTLALRNPTFDNAVPENWTSSITHGTPGENNDVFMTDTIVINEINYNSSEDFNPEDWVEFYNKYDIPVDISGWVFGDEDEVSTFVFPENTVMEPGGYVVVCRDTLLFQEVFPGVDNCIGNFDFGLSGGGETIYLYNTYGDVADSVSYNDVAPWPVEPDGNGPTLALINPGFDNSISESWVSSLNHGTPGEINDVFNTGVIVINEINYNSSDIFNPEDWVELYNPQDIAVDISGWIFKDEDETHVFVIPENTVIDSDNYLVLCRDASLFHEAFPNIDNYTGDFGFGLAAVGELIRLFNNHGDLIDALIYDDEAPWPVEPDGDGPTLALSNPNLDNALPGNWASSGEYGTPGEINDVYSEDPSLPIVFSLGQNYPNPFNTMTTIPLYLPETCRVTIEIYSILGRRVAKILDEKMFHGDYNIVFKPDDLASGLYIYTVKAGKCNKTKQMMFIK